MIEITMDVALEARPSFEPGFIIRVRLPQIGQAPGELQYKEAGLDAHAGVRTEGQILEASDVVRMVRLVDEIQVPLAPPFAAGLDGTTVTLRIECGMNSAAYTWWGGPPAQCSGVRALADELLRLASVEARDAW